MKKLVQLGTLSLLAFIVVGCNVEKRIEKVQSSLTMINVQTCIKIENPPLEEFISYDTESCLDLILMDDMFVRAWRHKDTGLVKYQIYFENYSNKWEYPYQLNYKFGGNLVSVSADKINSDVNCGGYGCTHTEEVGFDIDEDYLADLSERYDEIKDTKIIMRVQKKGGENKNYSFNPAELVGIYRKSQDILEVSNSFNYAKTTETFKKSQENIEIIEIFK